VNTLPLVLLASLAQAPAPPAGEPDAVRIGGEIQEPRKVKNVAPEYPEEARRAGLGGMVVIECTIDLKGNVREARVEKGVPPLTDAALKAVRKWRYTPTLLNGVVVPVIMTVTVNFKGSGSLNVRDLLGSLDSENEHIRASATAWLGEARTGSAITPDQLAEVVRRLEKVRDGDSSAHVRAIAVRSLAEIGPSRR
jgi:TonB family protein